MRTRPFALMLLALSACSSTSGEDGPPLALDADPATTGLVAVEARMTNRSAFGTAALKVDGGSITCIETGRRWYAHQRERLLIFDDLPPGTYFADYVKAEPGIHTARSGGRTEVESGTRSYRLPHTSGFEFVVEPGVPAFVGPFTASNGRSRGDVWVDVHEEPSAEGRAWRKVLQLYPASDWAPILRERLEELR